MREILSYINGKKVCYVTFDFCVYIYITIYIGNTDSKQIIDEFNRITLFLLCVYIVMLPYNRIYTRFYPEMVQGSGAESSIIIFALNKHGNFCAKHAVSTKENFLPIEFSLNAL